MATRRLGWKDVSAVAVVAVVTVLSAGCMGETSLSAVEVPEGYDVRLTLDPPKINPPQSGSLTFDITDKASGDRVTQFEPIYGSNTLMHNFLLREDLEYFRHETSSYVIDQSVSVPALFPTEGSYKTFAIYKPLAAPVQEYQGRIVAAGDSPEPNLEVRELASKLAGSIRIDRIGADAPVVAGKPQQLAFQLSEKGQAITSLGPVYGAPAHLWITNSEVEHLWHAVGKSESRRLLPTPTSTPTPVGLRATPLPEATSVQSSSSQGDLEIPAGVITDTKPPTLVPELSAALATLTAGPVATLPPVQQTAFASILGTPAVPPVIGYGPVVIFEHTFPEPGLYKLWLEVGYRNEVITTDWVVRVVR